MLGWIKVLLIPSFICYRTIKSGRKEWKEGNKFGGVFSWLLSLTILLLTLYLYWRTITYQH